jgi:Rrf2 family transcriptional regulator, iron-sulfur cluster assembly transcription factor
VLSKTSKYCLQALILIASLDQKECVLAKQIAGSLSIPKEYLNKVLRLLVKEKFLVSLKGPQGGFSLARPSHDITVYEIITVIDGTEFFDSCIIQPVTCDENKPCALHDYWHRILRQIRTVLDNVTLADLVKELKSGKRVLNFHDDYFLLEKFKQQIGIL